jgi:hypothetical protein
MLDEQLIFLSHRAQGPLSLSVECRHAREPGSGCTYLNQ